MGEPQTRIKRKLENAKREQRQSRKESRAKLMNIKRNIYVDEPKDVKPVLSEAEKLRLWRIEKKKKMDEEKLRKRPPFKTYINVKHTGTSPFKLADILKLRKGNLPRSISEGRVTRTATAVKPALEIPQNKDYTKFTFHKQLVTVPIVNSKDMAKKKETTHTSRKITDDKNKKVTKLNSKGDQNKASSIPVSLKVNNTKVESKVGLAAKKTVQVVEKKPLRQAQLNVRSTYNTRSTKKVENIKTESSVKTENKKLNKPNVKNEKAKSKKLLEEIKENIPVIKPQLGKSNSAKLKKDHPVPATKKKTENKPKVESIVEPENGPTFQRKRLEETTTRLEELKMEWLIRIMEDGTLPETVYDEILSVTGQTALLISSKFKQFRSLIEDCVIQLANPSEQETVTKVTPDDLDGFWEMMYLQVVQLRNKYINLEKLMMNNWMDPCIMPKKKERTTIARKSPTRKRQSRFQDFIKRKQTEENSKIENKKISFAGNSTTVDITVTNEDPNLEYDPLNLSSLKNCLVTPKAVKNLLKARNSRRSSMNIVMSMSGVGKFDMSGVAVSSPARNA